jgi:hypothetical protein
MAQADDILTGDYVVPIYVDTGALVDVLASIEGGFTSIEKFTSRTEDGASSLAGSEFAVGGVPRSL